MPRISRWVSAAVFAIVILMWLVTPFITTWLVGTDMDKRGQAGDLFGSINALFSGLAFTGVVIAILLQREELSLQRQELRETREELKRSANAQEHAYESLDKTIYASTFKVALDIIQAREVALARRELFANAKELIEVPVLEWKKELLDQAEIAYRSFESIGLMVRKGLLPPEYIIDSWAFAIVRYWTIMESFVEHRRSVRHDPFVGKDFEWLAATAKNFLKDQQIPTQS